MPKYFLLSFFVSVLFLFGVDFDAIRKILLFLSYFFPSYLALKYLMARLIQFYILSFVFLDGKRPL